MALEYGLTSSSPSEIKSSVSHEKGSFCHSINSAFPYSFPATYQGDMCSSLAEVSAWPTTYEQHRFWQDCTSTNECIVLQVSREIFLVF